MASSRKLGEVLQFANGRTSPDRMETGAYPVYGSNGIIGNTNERNSPPSTIIIGRVGTYCGSLYYSTSDCWVTDNAIRANQRGDNDPRFLFYLLGTLNLNDHRAGSGQPLLNQTILSSLDVSVPDRAQQEAIASILGTLDDRIALLHDTNRTLEDMARLLFRAWFVDFEPVRAKMEGRASTSCDAATTALFPDRLVESELGEVPEGWEVAPISSFASLRTPSIHPQRFPEEVFDHFSIPAFDEGRRPKAELGTTIQSNKYQVEAHTVLVSKLNPNTPRIWWPELSDERRAICSTEFMQFLPADREDRAFLYCLMSSEPGLRLVEATISGSTGSRQRAQPSDVASARVVLPSRALRAGFSAVAQPLLSRAAENIELAWNLGRTRDELLPRLMSGALTVPEAA